MNWMINSYAFKLEAPSIFVKDRLILWETLADKPKSQWMNEDGLRVCRFLSKVMVTAIFLCDIESMSSTNIQYYVIFYKHSIPCYFNSIHIYICIYIYVYIYSGGGGISLITLNVGESTKCTKYYWCTANIFYSCWSWWFHSTFI